VQLLKRTISATLAIGLAAGLSTTVGASVRTTSLSSLIVPSPHGWHATSNAQGSVNGSLDFEHATSGNCNGVGPLRMPRSQWLGTNMRVYDNPNDTNSAWVCLTRLSSTAAATLAVGEMRASYAAKLRDNSSLGVRQGLVSVAGIPHATGEWLGGSVRLPAGPPQVEQIFFERGHYLVFVSGFGPATAKFAPSLARQQYGRLR
jgi:hypothetical protein